MYFSGQFCYGCRLGMPLPSFYIQGGMGYKEGS
jgi:hypothetical protein